MPTTFTNAQLQTAFDGLSILGVVFSSLSALFGVYFVLFVIALWATFKRQSRENSRLRVITIVLFIALTVHYLSRAVTFGQRRSIYISGSELYRDGFSIPLRFLTSITSTIAGLVADGVLVWRFYIIYSSKWALYVPSIAVFANFVLGFTGDLLVLTFYKDADLFYNHFEGTQFRINAAWGWTMLGTNTLLTGLIIGKIVHASRNIPSEKVSGLGHSQYSTITAALVESAFVTWVGLLLYGIANVAPHGHITTHLDVGFVMECIIPIFFGISQCLLIVRLGLSTSTPPYTAHPHMNPDSNDTLQNTIHIHSDIIEDSMRMPLPPLPNRELNVGLASRSTEKITALHV